MVPRMHVHAPRLISRSCTSGWFDWVWGDLWLTEDALLRISRGMAESRKAAQERKRRGGGSTVPDAGAIEPMTPAELDAKVSSDPKNRRVALGEIRTAKLRRGLLNGRLSVALQDGTRIKVLWLKTDPAYEVLAELLRDRLGSDLKLR